MANPQSIRQIAHSRAPLSTWLGVVLLFALFGVVVLAIIGPSPRGSDYEEMRAKKRMENLKTSREDAEKALNTYAWIDKNKGVVRIPISRAMELTTAQLAQQKPAPAGPIATPQLAPPRLLRPVLRNLARLSRLARLRRPVLVRRRQLSRLPHLQHKLPPRLRRRRRQPPLHLLLQRPPRVHERPTFDRFNSSIFQRAMNATGIPLKEP